MKEVNKTFFCTWLPGLMFIWYLIVMSQVQCRRNILELAHIQIYYLQCTLYTHTCTKDRYQKEKKMPLMSLSLMNAWTNGGSEPLTVTCCYSSWLHAYGHIYLYTTYTYTTYSGITQAINHLITCQWNETYDVCESTHCQQFSIMFYKSYHTLVNLDKFWINNIHSQ